MPAATQCRRHRDGERHAHNADDWAQHGHHPGEDTPYTFAAGNFPLTGPAGETLQSVTIVTLPATGTLKLSGVAVTAGQVITAANIANLTFTPVNGGTGSPYTTFPFEVTDASGATSASATETVNVTPTTPTTAPNTVTTPENTAYTFAAANFPLTGPARQRRCSR